MAWYFTWWGTLGICAAVWVATVTYYFSVEGKVVIEEANNNNNAYTLPIVSLWASIWASVNSIFALLFIHIVLE